MLPCAKETTVPLDIPLSGFFGDEWDRFIKGIKGLDPRYADELSRTVGRRGPKPGEPNTITIPGWDSVIKIGPRPETSPAQWREYYRAQREGRPANLPPGVAGEIGRLRLMREAQRRSTQPGWANAVGNIMTAIDNVQDLASTIATLGRLLLWGVGHLAPVASAAQLLADIRFASPALSLGEAAQLARALANYRALSLAARLGARAIPIVGWVVLAGDLLNLMNLLGMAAMPLYALLCDGPKNALLSGIPAAVLNGILCRKVWTAARLNPFSRTGRAARRLRSLGRLPSVGNLIEVAQVTDSLWGYGLSIGGVYGMAMEGLFALNSENAPAGTQINTSLLTNSFGLRQAERIRAMSEPQRQVYGRAARQLASVAPLMAVQADLDDETHLLTYAVTLVSLALAYEFFTDEGTDDWMAEILASEISAPTALHPNIAALMEDTPAVLHGTGRFAVPGNPRTMTAAAYITYYGPRIGAAAAALFTPRRDTWEGAFIGACINTGTDWAWQLIARDDHAIRWELSTDFKILTGMAVDGLLIANSAEEPAAWAFWAELRQRVRAGGNRLLEAADVRAAADRHNVPLVRLLGPGDPFPPEWQEWIQKLKNETPA
jgi:hypothetical protein